MYSEKANKETSKELNVLLEERKNHFSEIEILDLKIKKIKLFCTHNRTYSDDNGDIVCETCKTILKLGNRT